MSLHARWSALRSLIEQILRLAGSERSRLISFWDAYRPHGRAFCLLYGFAVLLERDWPDAYRALLRIVVGRYPELFAPCVRYGSLLMKNGEKEAGGLYFNKALDAWFRSPERGSPAYVTDFVETIKTLRSLPEIESAFLSFVPKNLNSHHLGLELIARFGLRGTLEAVMERDRELLRQGRVSVHLLRIRNIRDDPAIPLQELFPATPYTFREPPVFGGIEPRPERTVEAPACWIGSVSNVTVMGGFTVVRDDELIIYEPAAHPHHGFVAGCWEYLTPVGDGEDHALMWFPYDSETRLDEGILLSGRCSTNYFHWLIEYLPKGLALESRPDLRRVPLIVDADMPRQHFESLKAVMGDWPVHLHRPRTLLHVAKLWLASTPTFQPDRFDRPYWMGSALSEPHLDYLRRRALEKVVPGPELPGRIYLSRRALRGRSVRNERRLEKEFERAGFLRVRPETLSFLEQVRLFHNAEVVAGPGGAAMTNLLFCRPGAKVLGLTGERNRTYSMWANLSRKAGAQFLYVAGAHLVSRERCRSEADYAVSAFEIPPAKIRSALAELMGGDADK